MGLISKARRILRGDVSPRTVAREAMRRFSVNRTRRREQSELSELDGRPARLREEFARANAADLLAHFESRTKPTFFSGCEDLATTARMQQELFPAETNDLIERACRIADEHCWPLLGFGEKCFGAGQIDWNRDPLSSRKWPLEYHASLNLMRNDGSDARVVWELNRLSHFITLGRAYAITGDNHLSEAFRQQFASWREQNPPARGINWNCAMEVALRAMNVLAAFTLFRRAPQMDQAALSDFLAFFDQHGAHIRRHLEYSHIATSNHYLADVTGLLWIGVMLPELAAAREWREFGLRELLREMDKQVLRDGADYEASTGYHRLKIELWLYSFVLCRRNGIEIEEKYWAKLREMLEYLRAYLRPDGRAPLIGDSDSGQVLPIVHRRGNDHAYLLALGAGVFQEPRFKIGTHASGVQSVSEVHAADARTELLWLLGAQGISDYSALPEPEPVSSQVFNDAGVCILRNDDLYLLLNAGGVGVEGRGSHGHNDALSIEVSACGSAFIVDPGSYLYTANLGERHLFRSTAFHSTVQIDGVEQNSIEESAPFVIGNEARPRIIKTEIGGDGELIVAEHYGYRRLAQPVVHRRTVRFDKRRRFWLIQDELTGVGNHAVAFRFHLAPGRETTIDREGIVQVCDKINRARLLIACQKPDREGGHSEFSVPLLEPRFSSRDYGAKEPSVSVCWTVNSSMPLTARFLLVPLSPEDDPDKSLAAATTAIGNWQSTIANN